MSQMNLGRALGLGTAVVASLVFGACANTEGREASTTGNTAAAAQQVAGQEGGKCSLEQYGGEQMNLADATVGFSHSEKEANPFGIAETQSIVDEAKKREFQPERTNANSQLSKQVADINTLLANGVDALIVAPLNSDGLEPALNGAAEQGIPVITVDRELGSGFCQNWVTFIGSDFYEQGKRAAQAMVDATGGKNKVAICSAPQAPT